MREQLIFVLTTILPLCTTLLRQRHHPESCANFTLLKTLDPPGPNTVLASMPGSGNTWVRHLIQLATGIFTGSEYDGETTEKFPGGFIGNGSAVVIKDHLFEMKTKRYDRALLLVRNPLHQILAFTDWKTRNLHNNTRLFLKFHQHFFDHILNRHVELWQKWHERVLESFSAENIFVINYEDLRENVLEELQKCTQFLGFDIQNHILQNCILQNQTGHHKRTARPFGETQLILSFLSKKTRLKSDEIYEKTLQKLLNNSYHSDKCMG